LVMSLQQALAEVSARWLLLSRSHGRLKTFNLSFDVGVDCWNYKPVPWETMEEQIKSRTAEMELAGRVIKENGKALYRQDDVRWLMDKQGPSVNTDKSEDLILN